VHLRKSFGETSYGVSMKLDLDVFFYEEFVFSINKLQFLNFHHLFIDFMNLLLLFLDI
jgi:hypothetical protein